MNRRSFLNRLPFVVASVPVAALAKPAKTEDIPGLAALDDPILPGFNYKFKGYLLRWTGWKGAYNDENMVGQWLASPEGYSYGTAHRFGPRPFIYSNSGGVTGRYGCGEVFDLTTTDKRFVTWRTSEPERQRIKRQTLLDLIQRINGGF